jgi:hypothetical protein
MMEELTVELKVDPKIDIQRLIHKVAQTTQMNLPNWWHACVVDGTGDNQT